jgi:hypothetical protein
MSTDAPAGHAWVATNTTNLILKEQFNADTPSISLDACIRRIAENVPSLFSFCDSQSLFVGSDYWENLRTTNKKFSPVSYIRLMFIRVKVPSIIRMKRMPVMSDFFHVARASSSQQR